MAQNNSGKWLMLHKDGKTVVEGEANPDAGSVLAAPGATVPQDVVDKYGLADRMEGQAVGQVDFAGNPVVVVGGRAIAADALPADHPQYRASKPAAQRDGGRSAVTTSREPATADAAKDAPGKPHDAPRPAPAPAAAPLSAKPAAGQAEVPKPKG